MSDDELKGREKNQTPYTERTSAPGPMAVREKKDKKLILGIKVQSAKFF